MNYLPQDRNQEVFPQFQNGRVININEKPVEWYQPFDGNVPNKSFESQALYGIQNYTPLSRMFFSKDNVKLINDMIRYHVYTKSGDKKIVIGDQSTIQLEIMMRSIFLQHARHLPVKIREQVKELNYMVVNDAVPRILSEVLQYQGYMYRVENLPTPIELPKNMSSQGTRLLRSVTTTF